METTIKVTTLVNLITGFLGSYLIQIIKTYSGIEGKNAMALTVGVSLVLGIGTAFVAGEITNDAFNSVAQILAISTIVYQFLLKKA